MPILSQRPLKSISRISMMFLIIVARLQFPQKESRESCVTVNRNGNSHLDEKFIMKNVKLARARLLAIVARDNSLRHIQQTLFLLTYDTRREIWTKSNALCFSFKFLKPSERNMGTRRRKEFHRKFLLSTLLPPSFPL